MPPPEHREDKHQEETTIIVAVLDGDKESYALLMRRYNGPLFRYLLRMVGHHDEAEDLAQEAFLRAYISLASYNAQYRFSTWLFRIATNLALNWLKAKRRVISLDALQNPPDRPPMEIPDHRVDLHPDRHIEREELALLVQKCLEELPPAYRTVVALRHIVDLSYSEIASSTGIPLNTVRSRLHRGRERLGKCLAQQLPEEEQT
jgi:RNA polymerase sigma-70 factor (ECF subfamily)